METGKTKREIGSGIVCSTFDNWELSKKVLIVFLKLVLLHTS